LKTRGTKKKNATFMTQQLTPPSHHVVAEELVRPPVIAPGHTFATVTDQISAIVLTRRPGRGWLFGIALTGTLVMVLCASIAYLLLKGVGIWGINIPVAWGFAIVNFVWWVGIGHAGTFISAFLLLLRQDWRTSINRFAEAMTLFAVACAGMFPLLHMGRPWLFYWLAPTPTRCCCGRTSAARWCGTCSPSRRTRRFRCSSGTSA